MSGTWSGPGGDASVPWCLGPQLETLRAWGTWRLGLQSFGGNITPVSGVDEGCWLDPQLPDHLRVASPRALVELPRSVAAGVQENKVDVPGIFMCQPQVLRSATATIFCWLGQ